MAEIEQSGLTRRQMIKKGALLGGTVMWVTPAVQTVGMSRALAQMPSDNCVPQWASSVKSSTQGDRKDGSDVLAGRSTPANALGAPDTIFFSLGFGGTITVMFASPAYIGTGSDVVVIETTNGRSSYPLESALVEVSQDGTNFVAAGTATNKPSETSTIDLAGIALTFIQFVRLTDTTNAALHANDADGFDLNAVGIACNTP